MHDAAWISLSPVCELSSDPYVLLRDLLARRNNLRKIAREAYNFVRNPSSVLTVSQNKSIRFNNIPLGPIFAQIVSRSLSVRQQGGAVTLRWEKMLC